MKGCNLWSYHPYRPFLRNTGDIYICRLVPSMSSIHLEWLAIDDKPEYHIYCRVRGQEDFLPCGTTFETQYEIENLIPDTDYEFFVQTGEKKSLIRLARTGESVGTVVNYLHPDDRVYSFSGRYLCSPSLVRHPEGFLLASMDVYASDYPQNLTLIFRSDDEGATWHYVSELMPSFWGKMFIHKGELYMLSCSTEYGDLLIGKSTDGGKTFCAPVTLLRGSNGKNGDCGVHKNPQNVLIHNNRIYETLEWGNWDNEDFGHAAMVMSCHVDDDLLDPDSWHFTPPQPFSHFAPELSDLPSNPMMIEGTLVVSPDQHLWNVMRFGKDGCALVFEVNTQNPDAPLTYSHCMPFPAHRSKFMIKYDPVSDKYYSIASRIYDPQIPRARNLLSLLSSQDLKTWTVVKDLFDYSHRDPMDVGFQYVDFEMEGPDILYLCRTALNHAHNYHDSNYSTFHRICDFRAL